jgi:hypothetical protein
MNQYWRAVKMFGGLGSNNASIGYGAKKPCPAFNIHLAKQWNENAKRKRDPNRINS